MSVTAPDWAISVPSTPRVTTRPPPSAEWTGLTQAQLDALRHNLLESLYQAFVQLFTGGLLPGPATPQLQNWASGLTTALNEALPVSTYQFLVDAIANALGHPGTGHSWTDIEVYLGIIPPANVGAVLTGPSVTLSDDLTALATQLFGAPAVAAITTVEQDIAHFMSNSITGGGAPTSPNSAVAFLDGLFNFIPHTNVVVPPNPGSGSISWDVTSFRTPFTGPVTSLLSFNHNHTCGANANYLTVRLGFYSTYTPIVAVSYNNITVPLLVQCVAPDGNSYSMIFGLPNPPTGASLPVAVVLYSPLGSSIYAVAVQADSYIGVGSVDVVANNNSSGSNPSLAIASAASHYAICSMFAESNVSSMGSTPNLPVGVVTQYNSGDVPFSGVLGSADHMSLVGLDSAAGTASIIFGASLAFNQFAEWACTGVDLVPAPTTVLGSVFRVANTNAAAVNSGTGAGGLNLFPNSFFNTVQTGMPSPDLTYSTTGNTVTITMAGSYTVTIAVNLYGFLVNQWLGLNLIQTPSGGGALVKRGNTQYVSAGASTTIFSHTFQVYCSAGDTLQPGYFCSINSAPYFVGTADGLSTYFEVSLHNRGLLS